MIIASAVIVTAFQPRRTGADKGFEDKPMNHSAVPSIPKQDHPEITLLKIAFENPLGVGFQKTGSVISAPSPKRPYPATIRNFVARKFRDRFPNFTRDAKLNTTHGLNLLQGLVMTGPLRCFHIVAACFFIAFRRQNGYRKMWDVG